MTEKNLNDKFFWQAIFPALVFWAFCIWSPGGKFTIPLPLLITFRTAIIIYGVLYVPFTLNKFREFIKTAPIFVKWLCLIHSYVAIVLGVAMSIALLLDLTVGIGSLGGYVAIPIVIFLPLLIIKISLNPSLGKSMLDHNG